MSILDFWQYSWSLFLCDVNVIGLAAVRSSEGGKTGVDIFCTVGVELECWTEGEDELGTATVEIWSTAVFAKSGEKNQLKNSHDNKGE